MILLKKRAENWKAMPEGILYKFLIISGNLFRKIVESDALVWG